MRHISCAFNIFVLMLLAGCATGGKDLGAGPPDIKPTQSTLETAAQPKKPRAVIPQTEPAPPSPAPRAAVRQNCKVKRDAVEWVHVSGECRDGYAHGEGRARSVNGRRSYAGAFADGAFSGKGDYDWGNGVRYTGEFLNGRRNGAGMLVYPDGRKYTGDFKDNAYHGEGTYIDADGSKYAGAFENGYFQGLGTYTWASGDVYTGQFKANQMDGKGNYVRANGDRYVGAFKNNEMSGEGTYTWSNGDAYTGQFEDDKMSGKGIYTYADGSRYRGEFKKGRKHGAGILITGLSEIKQQWWNGLKLKEDQPSHTRTDGTETTGRR